MAVAPLDRSSTPPPDAPTPAAAAADSTRPSGDDLMEENNPHSTRKRPRLDSGSATWEALSADETPASRMSERTPDAPAAPEQEHPSRSVSRMAINMKSSPPDPVPSAPANPAAPSAHAPEPTAAAVDAGAHASNAISVSSSPAEAHSPQIEVADPEDMDQDPNLSSWKPLSDALRDPEVVQFEDQMSLADSFPKPRPGVTLLENFALVCHKLEKGSTDDTAVFIALKNWLRHVANNVAQLTLSVLAEDREFWEDLPTVVEYLLRRRPDFQPDEGQGTVACLEEFFCSFSKVATHMIHMDTWLLNRLMKEDVQPSDMGSVPMSRTHLSAVGMITNTAATPLYMALHKSMGLDLVSLVARVNDQICAVPHNFLQRLSEYFACMEAILPTWPQMFAFLLPALTVASNLADSGVQRKKYPVDEALVDSPDFLRAMQMIYLTVRDLDESYQAATTKKAPWVTSETSETLIRYLSNIYHFLCAYDPQFALQVAEDLAISIPEGTLPEDRHLIIFYGWKFAIWKRHILDGRMELRVHGVDAMQQELVQTWKTYLDRNPAGINNPIVQYLLRFLRESQIVEYIVSVDSHPQLICRSGNIVGFLIVTSTYTNHDTDTIWKAVTESSDPRTVSEILGMITRTFHMQESSALLYLCSKLLDLPLERFDARMVEMCENVLSHLRQRYLGDRNTSPLLDNQPVDTIPLRLCVRLIRESSATTDLAVEHKAYLQKFSGSQLSQFLALGLSEEDRMETYERCVQDIAEMNQFTVGSIQALNALLPSHDSSEMRRLATDFDLIRLMITELAHTVDTNQTDFTDEFGRTGFVSRVSLLALIIDSVPDLITPELGDLLWRGILMSKALAQPGRHLLWEMLCELTKRTPKQNQFVDRCIHEYLPEFSPAEGSFPEVLFFTKQTIYYQIRFDPPPIAGEGEIVSVPGMERIWSFILSAPPGSVETDATNFAIEVYLDHGVIRRSPRSAIEATHISLVDRCVEQLKSAASKLKSENGQTANGVNDSTSEKAVKGETRAEELKFSRSLLFLRQFLQGLRCRPQYSPPQGSPPELPARPSKGELVEIKYQVFDGGAHSKIRSFQIEDLSTASEFYDALVRVTGFSRFKTIHGGQRIEILENADLTVRDLRLDSALLIIRKEPDPKEVTLTGRRQSLTSVDSEVLKHFDDLYELLGLEDHLAREIYEFLVVFPPQERVLLLVKSTEKTEQDMFPMDKPFHFLYSVNALTICLREEALESSPNEEFVSHSLQVIVAALTRPEMLQGLADGFNKFTFAVCLVECLLFAISVRPLWAEESLHLPQKSSLAKQLLHLIDAGQQLSASDYSEFRIHKLICHSFAILIEGSVREPAFWDVVKQDAQFDRLLFALLLAETRQPVRKGIMENIAVVCRPVKVLKKPGKAADGSNTDEPTASDNPVRIDILGAVWDAFIKIFPRTVEHPEQSQEFFEIAYLVFHSVAEKSPPDFVYSEYLKQWGEIMLKHSPKEFVGREIVDHFIFGFSRLLKSCLELAGSTEKPVDTFDLTENLFDIYLFPDFSDSSSEPIVPNVPVLHNQTRQELYNILMLLCKYGDNYLKLVGRLDDIIPTDQTYSPSWLSDRYKMIRAPEGYAGLKNLSNTCYLNSLLTQLFMNVGFRDFMMQLKLNDPESSQRLLKETKKLFGHMQETWYKSVDPQELVDSIRTYDNEQIDVSIQMDVDEFYNLLFDRWEAQITDPDDKKKFRSFFGGQLVQQIKSKECPHISERFEPFSAIQCDIKGKATLEESLQAYVEGEIMQGDNKYSCTSCGRHVDAVKRACLKDVPDNLIFHLKRFDFDMLSMIRNKINDEFRFPEHIDMSPFKVEHLSDQNGVVEHDIFELVGVLVHTGTAESGHYYSYIRERPTADSRGSWVEFNDSEVQRFDPRKIPETCFGGYNDSLHTTSMGQMRFNRVWNAYMLFYQRASSMETAKSIYKPTFDHCPVRVTLPVPLGNHIAMENETCIRTFCLLDPYHLLFVRYMLSHLHEIKGPEGQVNPKMVKSVVFTAMETLEQLVARNKEMFGLDLFINELMRVIAVIRGAPNKVLQWVNRQPSGPAQVRNLVLRSPHLSVRNSSARIIACALTKLQESCRNADGDNNVKRERWARYLDEFEGVVNTLEGFWVTLHQVSRAWDEYFEFLSLLAGFGSAEAEIVLNYRFLVKCLELVWLDREDQKKLKRHYIAYIKLMEKGRRFSHRKLMDFMAILLRNIDLTHLPLPNDERRPLPDGRLTLNATESSFIFPRGNDGELLVLKKIILQNHSPQATQEIMRLFMEAEPEAGLIDPIFRALEDGLGLSPANLCAPFLDATFVFCRYSPDEDRVVAIIDQVTKGIETINDSGGHEHLSFLMKMAKCRNERLGLDETWFLTKLIDRVPDWAPTLLIFPDRNVRSSTMDALRGMLFTREAGNTDDDWQDRLIRVGRELVFACIERLRKAYLGAPGSNVDTNVVETIKAVMDHCLATYFQHDNEEDQETSRQVYAVLTATEQLAIELPEDVASESDVASAEEWEDNSALPSDSEMGLPGSP